MAFNPDEYEECPGCGGLMHRDSYVCAKCLGAKETPTPQLYPELLKYKKPKFGPCKHCEMKWLCRIWVFDLELQALCEIPDQNDLIAMRQNGKKKSVRVS
jgi:hypothetical protein